MTINGETQIYTNNGVDSADKTALTVSSSASGTITAGEDKIKFTKEITISQFSGNDIIFETASGQLTVKDGAGKNIKITDYQDKTTTANYTESSGRTIDLMYDNNFMSEEIGLDDISEKKFELTQIQTTEKNELNQPVISFTDDK